MPTVHGWAQTTVLSCEKSTVSIVLTTVLLLCYVLTFIMPHPLPPRPTRISPPVSLAAVSRLETMSTSGDEALEKALEHLKVRNSDYLQNQTLTTHSNLAGAMGRKIRALASTRDMIKQTSEMSQVKQDFENSTNPRKKIRIAHTLAETLVRVQTKQLKLSTVGQAYHDPLL